MNVGVDTHKRTINRLCKVELPKTMLLTKILNPNYKQIPLHT